MGALTIAIILLNGDIQLTVSNMAPGVQYAIQENFNNMDPTKWVSTGGVLQSDTGTQTIDIGPTNSPCFFRVMQLP